MPLKKTPLHSWHKEHNGRMVPFAGWEMPVQYSSIIEEHKAVREFCGLFDVSHMGEIRVTGAEAGKLLETMCCNNVESLKEGKIRYNAILNEKGGVRDDVTIFRRGAEEYFIIVNASNTDKVYAAVNEYCSKQGLNAVVNNESDNWHLIAIQGPEAESILSQELNTDLTNIGYFAFLDMEQDGRPITVSRTGYTGEDGFEILSDANTGTMLWQSLLNRSINGRHPLPVGLGARDSLRLEARYPLYGHELAEDLSPVESGIGWIVKEKEVSCFAMAELLRQKEEGTSRNIVGFALKGPGIPREDYRMFSGDRDIGKVVSGGHSPILKGGIGTALLEERPSGELSIEIRQKRIPVEIVEGPFVQGTAGKKRKDR
ncbi:MAG: glycine cleavage system aminomethyltransferase GcvT [Leptospiraceae bacterium]|nr:glycine cleavage system aminomethyltransferase GcvT [Leptospiraceae bacterium]